jgi:type 2 lantibiotic biosynthesis protein LanM
MIQKVASSISQENSSNSLDIHNQLPIKISTQDLIQIVEQASTISERLSQEFIPKVSEKEQKIIDARLEQWCQIVAKGDREKFLKHLSWDNLDINSVRPALDSVSLVYPQSLPLWTDTLRKAMEIGGAIAENIFDCHKLEQYQYLDAENPLPFEEIYLPFVEVAKQKLAEKIGSSYHFLGDKAYCQLQSGLLRQLTNVFAKVLDLEFSLFRAYRGSQLVRLINKLQNNSSGELYEEFVANLLGDGLLAFFQEYSVLARLAAIATDFWVEATAEFLRRLASDWDKIERTFAKKGELGQVVAIQTGLSDPHNRGRSVSIVKFTSDLKLVYKPKNLGLEQAYFNFLTWINQQDTVLSLKTLKIVNRSTHGWIEFVEALPCKDQEAVKRYYQRAGMILCLVYALKGTDCHRENLIACGEQPVLVDLETLFHHQIWAQEENAEAIAIANEKFRNSVMATALLPGAQIINLKETKEKAVDISGLGNNGEEISVRSLRWENINTDNMAIIEEKIKMSPEKNQPFGEDLDTSLSNYVEELVTGFKGMYRFLRDRKKLLLAPDSPLAAFANQKVRLVLRNTQLYASILQNSLNPKLLRNGIERSIELDILSRGFLSSETKPDNWGLLAAEKQALEQLDIPYITAYSDRNDITINSEVTIEKFLNNPSYEDVTTRLQQLSDDNLAAQISIIRGSLYSCSPSQHRDVVVSLDEIAPLNREAILHQAINIGEELEQRAIRGNNHSVAWLGMTYNFPGQKFQLRPLDYSLYDGHCGVALFLAALAKITDKGKYADLALDSLYSFRKILWEQDTELQAKLAANMGIGGATGLASVVYALVRVAKFLNEAKLIEEAQQIAAWMQIDESVVEPKLGIFDGVAGTILSLLSLYRATNQAEILEQANAWGKYLLNKRQNIDKEPKIWINSPGEPLAGFFKGIAGISYALLCLYAANQEAVFLTAAIDAIAFEQSYLFQEDDSPDKNTSWCHGAPGIALARLGSLNTLDTSQIRQELETILQSIQQPGIKPLDNLCCGNFAELEVLLLAADKLDNSGYLETSRQKLSQILSRRDRFVAFQLLPNLTPEVSIPGFSQGSAGIGYGLLRFLYPHKLPSILLWQ